MTDLSRGVDEYLAAIGAERGLAPASIDAYRRDLRQYCVFVGATDSGPEIVSAWIGHLHDRGLAPATVARKVAAIRGLHRFLVAEGLGDDDPTALAQAPRRPRTLPRALAIDEVIRLLEAPDPSRSLGRRDRALLEFMYATGARVAEAVGLNQIDLDLEGATALLTGKGGRNRLVPVGRLAVAAIESWLPDRLALRRSGRELDYGELDITLYRDDLATSGGVKAIGASDLIFDLTDRHVILVDDVLYTARTVRAALTELNDYGRPQCIRLLAFIDRGGRELPITPDFTGTELNLPPEKKVRLHLQEVDREERVVVEAAGSDL